MNELILILAAFITCLFVGSYTTPVIIAHLEGKKKAKRLKKYNYKWKQKFIQK